MKGEIIRDSPLIPIMTSFIAYFLTCTEAFATTCILLSGLEHSDIVKRLGAFIDQRKQTVSE